jgi:hypothetical protein
MNESYLIGSYPFDTQTIIHQILHPHNEDQVETADQVANSTMRYSNAPQLREYEQLRVRMQPIDHPDTFVLFKSEETPSYA